MRIALILSAALAGCAAPATPALPEPTPAISIQPAPARLRPVSPAKGKDSPAAVTRDTEALQDQATQYVIRKDSQPAVIDQLSAMTRLARRAASHARASRRAADIIAARSAADSLAAYINTQTQARD